METKGKTGNSKCTKHIKIQYFFITDKINQNEAELSYCPTESIWSDALTKPLQGAKFRKM